MHGLAIWAKSQHSSKVLLHYNTFAGYTLIGAWLRLRYGVRIVPIAVTLPYSRLTNPTPGFKLQQRLSAWLLRHSVDGLVAISPQLSGIVAPGVPVLVVRGAVLADQIALEPQPRRDGPIRVVYTGTIYDRYHLIELAHAVEQLGEGYELHLYGRGEQADEIAELAKDANRIHYHGPVSPQEVRGVQVDADVLATLLDPDDDLARYSFPSKIFEYLASGRPVLASNLKSFDEQMRPCLEVVPHLDVASIAEGITNISARTSDARDEIWERTRSYLRESATWSAVGCELAEFIVGVAS